MPHSLRARLSGLRYKKIISDKDYDRLCKALDNENTLDRIIAEIEEYKSRQLTLAIGVDDLEKGKQIALEYVLAIIDHYKGESEVLDADND